MIFPFLNGDAVGEEKSSEEDLPLLKEVAWDFEEDKPIINKFGEIQIVEGVEALKIWIYKAIKISRFEYDIYSWDYGCEVNTLLGQSYYSKGHIESESKRYIREAVSTNPYIKSINFKNISFSDDKLNAEFEVDSVYGEVNIVV